MKRLVLIAVLAIAAAFPAGVSAAAPNNPSCWGAASADLAQSGAMGQHASSFDEPRQPSTNERRQPPERQPAIVACGPRWRQGEG